MTRPGSQGFDDPPRENWHFDLITEHLKAFTLGQIKRLLINMPQNRRIDTARRLVQPRLRHVSFWAIERAVANSNAYIAPTVIRCP